MGYNQSTSSNSGTPVGNNWQQMLGSGLIGNGQYSNGGSQTPGQQNASGQQAVLQRGSQAGGPIGGLSQQILGSPGFQQYMASQGGAGGSNPSGGMGAPGAAPGAATAQTGGLAGYINNQLNTNPSQLTYNDPNNPRPQGYTPTQIGNQQAPQYNFNAIQNPGASAQFNQAQSGQLGIADALGRYGGQNGGINPASMGAPAAPGVEQFSSQGILGDRSNIVSAITNAANLQSQQALAAQNARFTQMGGMSGGTPAAYATAQTNAQQGVGLANALAQADINYRNLDLGGYQAQNQAQQQQFGTQANIFGTQQNALGQFNNLGLGYGQLGLGAANSAANIFGNVANQQFNQQGMGLNYAQLGQQGQQANNQLNLNSALGFGQLNNQAQQYNNQNSLNSATLAQNAYGQQGQLDLGAQGQAYNQQQNTINQLFNSYNNAYNHGTPQAQTTYQPNFGQNLLNAVPGLVNAGTGLASSGVFGQQGGGGQQNIPPDQSWMPNNTPAWSTPVPNLPVGWQQAGGTL